MDVSGSEQGETMATVSAADLQQSIWEPALDLSFSKNAATQESKKAIYDSVVP